MWKRRAVVLLLFLSAATAAPAPFADEDSWRLPGTSKPLTYELELTTNVHTGTRYFEGFVRIEIEIIEETNVITLHNHQLRIENLELLRNNGAVVSVVYSQETEKDFLHIESSEVLENGAKLYLEIKFNGNLQLGTVGFYRSSYVVEGQTRYLATTQFEATEARSAFICYDEPEYKAEFTLTINHGSVYHAISNMKGVEVDNGDGTKTTTFEKTPRMPSYLLAFVISDLDYITNENQITSRDIAQRVYARAEDVDKTQYALKNSVELLDALEEYVTGFEYPFEIRKVYSVAVPDFGLGAMENWGLITYKEQYLIGDENSHPRDVSQILKTIAHELGHQFFGNAVTCKWWDQIWLNEGFATFLEYKLVDLVYPSIRMDHLFVVEKLQNAMRVDAYESTRPMWFNVETPAEISAAFDRIAYDKSGSVIRMFGNTLGEEVFQKAMGVYLINNNFGSVTSDDLYEAFESVIAENGPMGFSFTDAFKTWEVQKGFPIVHVTADDSLRSFVLTQQRYLAANEERIENDERSWYIPLSFTTSVNPNFNDKTFTHYFVNGQSSYSIPYPEMMTSNDWYIFNTQQMGYYRVNYDQQNWQELTNALHTDNFGNIHVLSRTQLIDDSLNFAVDGYLDFSTAFSLLSYLEKEVDYIPWQAASVSLDRIDYLLQGQPIQVHFRRFVKRLIRRMYVTYGMNERSSDGLMEKFARELAINWSCRMGDVECLLMTDQYVKQALNGEIVIPDSLEVSFLCYGLMELDKQNEYVEWWTEMQNSNDQARRLRIIDGLLCSSDSHSLMSLLETTLVSSSETNYRMHERTRIVNAAASRSPIGVATMLEFLTEYFDEYVSMFGSPDSLILSISQRIVNFDDEEKLIALFEMVGEKLNSDTITTAMKNVDGNKEFIASSKFSDIVTFVSEYIQELDDAEDQLRLPLTSEPINHKLHLDSRELASGSRAFTGELDMDIRITQTTDKIIFHSKTHEIHEIKLFNTFTSEEVQYLEWSLHPATDTLTIYFFENLVVNLQLTVHIKYSAIMPTSTGYYMTSYTLDGRTRYVGATQFQSTSARYAFPHYDEPGFKAVFELSITHDPSQHAIANTFGTSVDNADGTITTTFEPSPIMSSYLLAFVVSDLEHISNEETKLPDETLHRIWVRPDSTSKAWLALEASIDALKALEDYVGFKYELPKVDSAGVPNKGGAMENWGMVIYRENAMIYEEKPEDIPHAQKFSGIDVIGHELAHQFFGNTVTCEWWDYIWLNEGFATLFQYQLSGIVHPDWNIRDFFNVRTLQSAFRSDSGNSPRAMTPTPSLLTLGQISGAFDYVVYGKAGTVLRMFQNAVGETIFKVALKLYLETYDHKPVNSQNLIDSFQNVMNIRDFDDFNFETVFRTWELNGGYPMISVSFSSSGQFEITQQRYTTNKQDNPERSSWYIPLNFATASDLDFDDTSFTNYFPSNQDVFMIDAPAQFDGSQWYVFNKQQLGYYRVMYDFNNYHALIAALNSADFDKIHRLNRAQILDDAINFAQGGYLDYSVVFGLMEYLSRETEYAPWFDADRFITTLYTVFGPFNEDLNAFIRQLTSKFYNRFAVPDDGMIPYEELYERYSRELALKLACNGRSAHCLEGTFNVVKHLADHDMKLPSGLEVVIFCNGLRGRNKQTEWSEIWKKMQSTSDTTFKSRAITALGCSDDPIVLKDYLESTLGAGNSVNYTAAERRNVLSAVLNSDSGLQAVIDFLTEFGSSVVGNFGYGTWEAMITVLARTIKVQNHQTIFNNYLQTVTQLDDAARGRINTIVATNFELQQQSPYAEFAALLSKRSENQLRLPETSEPTYYKIHLDVRNIHTGDRNFRGEVEIDIRVTQITDRIMIHSKTQVIEEVKAYNKNDMNELEIIDFNLYPATDTLTVYFMNAFVPNDELILRIKYTTVMPTSGTGFYQTNYNFNGVRYVGSTQFQPTGARYAFPNYDEPGFKTPFELTITHDTSVGAIANTFGTSVNNVDGTITTTFEPTPIMSSYLLAFVVSDFEYISNEAMKLPEETLHRIWVRPNAITRAWYALEASIDSLKALEEYVGFKYELPKVDSAAIPNKNSAMENWGMVTYWETAMIYQEKYEDIAHNYKLSGVNVISHELAHQFFGDTVTCQWWDQIWLNEGFATMFAYHISGVLHPYWNIRHFFNIRELHNAFRSDARTITRPMTNNVATLSQISNSFDTIAYDKSGSILRMFQNAVGEEIFKAALQLYLETNDHKPVTSQHLVDAFATIMSQRAFTDFDFDSVMRSWELQAGYPMISVSFSSSGQFEITQKRFFTNINDAVSDTSSWHIPLNFATAFDPNFDDTKFTSYSPASQDVFMIDAPTQFDGSQWYVFNKQQLGYYRVMYDFNNWHNLIVALNSEEFEKIHVLNRVQLIDDAVNFAQGGYLDYSVLFGLMGYLERETEYTPWYAAERFINTLYTTFGPLNDDLNMFVRYLSETLYEKFKLPEDSQIPQEEVYERYNREIALRIACNSGNELCLRDTYVLNHLYADHDRQIPKGLENVIFCNGLRGTGKQGEWTGMWNIMQSTSDTTLKAQLLSALGCSDDPIVLKDYLESTLGSGNSVNYTLTERRNVLSAVLNSHSGLEAVINFMVDFELEIIRNFAYGTLETMISVPARTVKTQEQRTMFNNFLATLTHLEGAALDRVNAIITNNFVAQQQPQNVANMETIRKIVVANQGTTTPITASPTSTTTSAPVTDPASTETTPSGTSPVPAETTTGSASAINFKLFTLFACLFITFTLKM